MNRIIYTKNEVIKANYTITETSIKKITLNIIAHFGNIPCIEIIDEKGRNLFPSYNLYRSLGYVLRNLLEFLKIDKEDGLRLDEISNLQVRVISDGFSVKGLGLYNKDEFMFFEDMLPPNDFYE